MSYIYYAIKLAPIIASVATVTSTVHSTIKTIKYVSSWIYGEEKDDEEEYWQYIDGGPVFLECD